MSTDLRKAISGSLENLARLVQRPTFWLLIFMFVLGLILLVIGYFFEEPADRPHILSFVAASIGVGLLVSVAAEFLLVEHASRSINERTEDSFNKLRDDFTIVTSASQNGLTNIFSPRRSGASSQFAEAIHKGMRNTRGCILVAGISLREFTDLGNPVHQIIGQRLKDDSRLQIRLLLLNPYSDAAMLRTGFEESWDIEYFSKGQLVSDLVGSAKSLQKLCERAAGKKSFSIDVRFYSFSMPFYMIAFDDSVYFEPYHFARFDTDDNCIGGLVPLMQFSETSDTYKRLRRHFDTVWDFVEGSSNIRSDSRLKDRIPWTIKMDQMLKLIEPKETIGMTS
jgi:hypothetical protein